MNAIDFMQRVYRKTRFKLTEIQHGYWKWRFEQTLPRRYWGKLSSHQLPQVRVFSFAGIDQLHLQVLSILSFLRHAGVPGQWTVVSDGSLTPEAVDRLRQLHPVVEIGLWEDYLTSENRAAVESYIRLSPMGKKLALLTGMTGSVALYVDSDVLFFEGARRLRELLTQPEGNYFLRDSGNLVFEGMATAGEKRLTPVNAGFLIQTRPILWKEPLDRLLHCLQTEPERCLAEKHYLEQTAAHLAWHQSGAQALDDHYCIDLSDAYDGVDRFCGPKIALRHYLWNTRWKFWGHASSYLR